MEFVLNETLIQSLNNELSKRKRKTTTNSLGDTASASRPEAVYLELIPTEVIDLTTQKIYYRDSRSSKKALVVEKPQGVLPVAPVAAELANVSRWNRAPSKGLTETRVATISATSKRTLAFWVSPNPKEYLYGISCFCKSSDTEHLPGLRENNKNTLFITDILGWDKKEAIKVKRTVYVRYEKRVTREEIENIDAAIKAKEEQAEQLALRGQVPADGFDILDQLKRWSTNIFGSYSLSHSFFFPVDFGYSSQTTYNHFTAQYSDWERYGHVTIFSKIRKTESSPLKYLESGCIKLLESSGCFGRSPFAVNIHKVLKQFIVEEEVQQYSQKNEQGLTLLSSEWLVKCLFPKMQLGYIKDVLNRELDILETRLKSLQLQETLHQHSLTAAVSVNSLNARFYTEDRNAKKAAIQREIQNIQVNRLDEAELERLEANLKLLSSKSFRKYYQSIFDEVNNTLILNSQNNIIKPETSTLSVREAATSWCTAVFSTVSLCLSILKTWPDCPIDLLSNNLDRLAGLTKIEPTRKLVPVRDNEANVLEWVRKNLKPHTYFSIINGLEVEVNPGRNSLSQLGNFYAANGIALPLNAKGKPMEILSNIRGMELVDTFDMLTSVLATVSNVDDLAPPPRWRITTFHDYIMKKSWELKGPGEALPKVLLKEAINLKAESGRKWSFTQPNCSNELAWWGKTVRNCVGSSGYVERVKNKTSFIIFCFVDDKPSITVNLKLQNGRLVVQEIRQPSNRSLDTQTNTEFQILFNQVLEILTKGNEAKDERNPKSPSQV